MEKVTNETLPVDCSILSDEGVVEIKDTHDPEPPSWDSGCRT